MLGISGKGQSVTALPDSVLSQCCLEVTLLNGNVTTVDFVFIQYMTRDGSGTKIFVEYAPNFGGIQWETQIRIQDDFDEVIQRSKFIMLPFTVATTDYAINRNWIANIETNATTGGTWIYGRFGTPTKRKFSAVEDYSTMKALLLACRPRAIIIAENGLYTEGDTVRLGGVLIEPTRIESNTHPFTLIDTLTSQSFGLTYNSVYSDTAVYFARRWGKWRNLFQQGRNYASTIIEDTTGGDFIDWTIATNAFSEPNLSFKVGNNSQSKLSWLTAQKNSVSWIVKDADTNPYYTHSFTISPTGIAFGNNESGSGDPGNGVSWGASGFGTTEYLWAKTKAVDNNTATVGQFLQLKNVTTGEVDFASVDLSPYLLKSDTAAMLANYPSSVGFGILKSTKTIRADTSKLATRYYTGSNFFPLQGGTLTGTGGAGFIGLPSQVSAPGTPASGLNIYAQGSSFNWKGTDGYERLFASTLTGGRTYTLPDVSGIFALGSGTTDRSARWSATNTLAAGNITDNGTKLQALLPWQFQSWNDAGRPTGVTGYTGYNTTGNGPEWHNGTRWAKAVESTVNAGTSTYIPWFNSNGQLDQNANFVWDNAQSITGGGTGQMRIGGSNNGGYSRLFVNGRFTAKREYLLDRTAGTFAAYISCVVRDAGEAGSLGTGLLGQAEFYTFAIPLSFGTFNSFPLSFSTSNTLRAQITSGGNFLIGTSTDAASAILNITSTNKGILPPRWTAAQLAAISSPATGLFGYQTDGTEGVYVRQSSAWKRLLWEGDAVTTNIYTANGTFGAGRIGTLTDSLRFRFGSNDLFRLKSNGVLSLGMPTESNSLVITTTPSENYNNYRGIVFLVGTTSDGDTTTGIRRNNHDGSYFSGVNLVEGGNNVYYDAVAGYGNQVRGDQPKNIIFGIGNVINSVSDVGVYGAFNTLSGSNTTIIGRSNTVTASDAFILGRNNTLSQNNAFVYGSVIATTNATRHGFGTLTPGARIHAKSLSGVPTILADGGEIQANAYGTQAKEASDLSKTFGNVAAFATDGTVLDYRITRDTSVSNADFTVTSTLLSSCQELFISAEVTSSATDTVNIILPTPSATYKNNKVYVFGDDDSSTQWVATKSVNATGLYYSNGGVKPTATNYAAVTTTTGVSGVTYTWICTRRNSGTWHWVLIRQ